VTRRVSAHEARCPRTAASSTPKLSAAARDSSLDGNSEAGVVAWAESLYRDGTTAIARATSAPGRVSRAACQTYEAVRAGAGGFLLKNPRRRARYPCSDGGKRKVKSASLTSAAAIHRGSGGSSEGKQK